MPSFPKKTPNSRPKITTGIPAVILAPMDGLADAPIRALLGEIGGFTYGVSEFIRVSGEVPGRKVFRRDVPEILSESNTPTGLPVQVQLLGGHAGRMAEAAYVAYSSGATAIDINFGCPAPTVNRHDGGATLLKYPSRIFEIVAAIRDAVPSDIPVSAKLRLGWDNIDDVVENARMAELGGASWITIHGRTKAEGYRPPAHWEPIGKVKSLLAIPVVANGDIMSVDSLRRCRDITGCEHFMLGRGALADPTLANQAAAELGIQSHGSTQFDHSVLAWSTMLRRLAYWISETHGGTEQYTLARMKQWLSIARNHGSFRHFDAIKRALSVSELLECLECADRQTAGSV